MKLVHKRIERDHSGVVALLPEEAEDMWHIYNLIAVGDQIRASTVRRVHTESSTGTIDSSRVRVTLTISVTAIEFDINASTLRINGRNVEENRFVKLGAFHTVDLELNQKFSLYKAEWDSIALERIENACDVTRTADVAAVVLQEGLAHVCLITPNMTIVRQRIEVAIAKKRRGDVTQHEKGMQRFFEQILQAVLRVIDFSVVKCIILASPGFFRDQLFQYMFEQAVKLDIKVLHENRSKFLLAYASSGHKFALREVLQDPTVMARMADTKALGEVKVLAAFFQMMHSDPDRAFYGYRHVALANEQGAVDALLITDGLFRSANPALRRRYVDLVDSVKERGGHVYIFSSAHVSGEQLAQVAGIAAILRFPLPDVADEDPEDADALAAVAGDDDADPDVNHLANVLAMIPASGRQSPDLGS